MEENKREKNIQCSNSKIKYKKKRKHGRMKIKGTKVIYTLVKQVFEGENRKGWSIQYKKN